MTAIEKALSGDAPLKGGMLWLVAMVLAGANFIAVLDMTIANVSVPSIAGALGISSSQGPWVITCYSVAEAITVPLTGWLAARFGAVRVFTTAMGCFGVFSLLCGFSTSFTMLVIGRILQGVAGGPLIPLSQTLLLRIFPKEKAAAATALWAMTTLVAPILGPILGGWLCDSYHWSLIFLINVPLAIAMAPFAWKMLKRFETRLERSPIDLIGLTLMVIAVGALQLMLDLGKEHDWFESGLILGLAVTAAVGLATFVIWEMGERHPVVNLRVFRHRGFTTAVIVIAAGFGAMFAANVLTPLWLQSYMGYTSTWAGLATAWTGVLAVVCAPAAGLLSTRVDPRKLVFFGLVWLGGVLAIRTGATTQMDFWQISGPLLAMGVGLPFFFVPITSLALASVEEHEVAGAAGLMNFLRTLSGAVATSVVTTSWESKTQMMHSELSGLVDRMGEVAHTLAASGMNTEQTRQALDSLVQSQSVMLATNEIMACVSLAFFLSALLIWAAPKPGRAVQLGAAH
ncbi:MAG TPA: DHA2 family efflux MFS transporter permease subunit [Steroidobacteraceae bacterium]|nr:DHA2 family efflux MFS transporter permease subunit [Steroidobacteraceae bacterium]